MESRGTGRVFLAQEEGRLLPFLLGALGGKSRNHVKGLLGRGQIQVDGKKEVRFDCPLRPGQRVTVLERAVSPPPMPVLYEDDDLLVVEKPAGLLSVSTGRGEEQTAYRLLTDWLREARRDARVFVVHRLDRDTSGVLVFARNEQTKRLLQENWNERVRSRGYLAIVQGRPKEDEGVCRSWLRETSTHRVYSGQTAGQGVEAVTRYTVLETKGNYSLLRAELETGRKNQIRVHFAELDCPVVGDKKYGASASPVGRLGLHAFRLCLDHPHTGEPLALIARAPASFRKLFPKINDHCKDG